MEITFLRIYNHKLAIYECLRRCGLYMQWNSYSAMRKNEILPFAATWKELGCIMLSEISQAEKYISCVFTHMWNLRNLTEDHVGRVGEKIVSNKEGDKP